MTGLKPIEHADSELKKARLEFSKFLVWQDGQDNLKQDWQDDPETIIDCISKFDTLARLDPLTALQYASLIICYASQHSYGALERGLGARWVQVYEQAAPKNIYQAFRLVRQMDFVDLGTPRLRSVGRRILSTLIPTPPKMHSAEWFDKY